MHKLRSLVSSINNRGYKAYKKIRGVYNFPDFTLYIDYVQGDPFASPSKLRIRVPQAKAGFGYELFKNRSRKIALEDYITRCFSKAIKKESGGRKGSGKSGLINIDCGKQEILQRASCRVEKSYVEARFYCGLPARGRRILADNCLVMLTEEIPKIASSSLFYGSLDQKEVKQFVETAEDQDYLRNLLKEKKLITFIKNSSILPRRTGISDKPLPEDKAVLFKSPPELEIELKAPNAGKVKGMGIPEGISLIIGGGFHGKTTLLSAIQRGVYNHIPGDGREYVVTVKGAVKIRAEEGRNIQKDDISPFISNLPFGKNTEKFSTADASGSTSQAANIIEALECRADLLLLDEDTSATNFLIRDEIMQKIVAKEKEPITPFIDQVRNIYDKFRTSTVLVMGGAGDYFEVADNVILMDSYLPHIVTSDAKDIISKRKDVRKKESPQTFKDITKRIPLASSINPYKGRKKKIKSRGLDNIMFGFEKIDLSSVEQIVDPSQVNSISNIISYALYKKYFDGEHTIYQVLGKVFEDIKKNGLEVISPFKNQHPGSYALPRIFETAAALNRLRSLKVKQKNG
ncbi:MAG: ABC-ATPase domain-containing protein [Actinomycetota bacterium]